MKKIIRAMLAIFVVAGASGAMAHERGDWLLRVGAAVVAPVEDSSRVTLNGLPLASTGVGVDSDMQAGFALAWMLSDHWGVELLAATPFKHRVSGKGLGLGAVADVKHLPPTLSLQYYPMAAGHRFQPYFGLGVNYTTFFSEEASAELTTAFGPASVSLQDSWGMAVQTGFDWRLGQRLSLNASIWRVDIDTTATIKAPGARLAVDVDLDPWVYMVGFAYHF